MSVHCPVGKIDYFILDVDDTYSLRIEVKGHVLVTFDVHEGAVHSEQGIQQGSILEVPPEVLPAPLCHLINYNRVVTIKNEHL